MNGEHQTALSIELSTAHGKIALTRADEVLFTAEFAAHRSHNAKLFEPLQRALELAGDDLALIVVGLGPGSYTGARIAIAAAQGIALSKSARVIGLPSIIAPDQLDHSGPFLVIGDARRGGYYRAVVSDGEIRDGIHLLSAAELAEKLVRAGEMPVITYDKSVADSHGIQLVSPSAVKLAWLGWRLALGKTNATSRELIEPIYLREAFITTPTRPWLKPGGQLTSTGAMDIPQPPPAP